MFANAIGSWQTDVPVTSMPLGGQLVEQGPKAGKRETQSP